MTLRTTSEGISCAKMLEDKSSRFYELLAGKCADPELFLTFSKENRKNIVQIERTYFGVITDAIEGGYAFNLEPENYVFDTDIANGTNNGELLRQAVEIEQKIIRFYSDAAEQSKSLMADIPRLFRQLVVRREERRAKLESLLGEHRRG